MPLRTKGLIQFLERFKDEETCREYYAQIRWKGKPVCPHCGFDDIWTYKSRAIYRCKNCDSQFRCTTGSIFQDSKVPLQKWFLAIYLICNDKTGISAIQLGKELNITRRRAWIMAHKIREALGNKKHRCLKDIVQCDETYVGGRRRGSKRGRGAEHKTPVFGMLQTGGRVRMMPVIDTKRRTLFPIIHETVRKGSVVMTDDYKSYIGLGNRYVHKVVNHSSRQYVNGDIHTNGIENVWSILKRGLRGTYIRPSRQYMKQYCKEFEFRFNNRHEPIGKQFNLVLKQSDIKIKG